VSKIGVIVEGDVDSVQLKKCSSVSAVKSDSSSACSAAAAAAATRGTHVTLKHIV